MASEDIRLTISQQNILNRLLDFVETGTDRVFVLKGYAGTGKTTLVRFLIQELSQKGKEYRLLASTGRAAKVLQNKSLSEAFVSTIHSMIYSYGGFNKDLSSVEVIDMEATGQLSLVFEPKKVSETEGGTIYIVDEASMISDIESHEVSQATFGSGRLLKELLEYDTRPGSRFVFVGDPCQLPPITAYFSPALSPEYITRTFGLGVQQGELTEIMRQDGTSTIITASKMIRTAYNMAPESKNVYGNRNVWAKLNFKSYRDILIHDEMDEMLDDYVSKIKSDGYNSAICLCRSNKACSELSHQVRVKLGMNTGNLVKGDLLMVTQNNLPSGLMNGDMVTVEEVTNVVEQVAGLTFRKIRVKENMNDRLIETYIIEDILWQDRPNLSPGQQNALFYEFIRKMRNLGIRQKDGLIFTMNMQADPMLNALRCTYGYAVTCHKAQGGEWDDVYVHVPKNIMLNPVKETYQWIYTAMTRARKRLHMLDGFYIA